MDGKEKSSQRTQILEYINEHGGITSFEGVNALHIVDIRKRISELRAKGWNIQSKYVQSTNRNGRLIRYKYYWMGDPARYE